MIESSKDTRERLLELFAQFPPVAIQTDAHLQAAQAVADDLVGQERDEAEELYLTADRVRALASFFRLPADLLLRETAAA